MLATAKNATKILCPLLITAQTVDMHCRGSECMMWRWDGLAGVNQVTGMREPLDQRKGYCGLAGPARHA